LSGPEIIILDEPTNGLDPSGMVEIRRLINRLARDHGITVFISSHMLHEVEAVCTKVAVINNGVLLAQGEVDDLLKKETLRLELRVSDKDKAAGILSKLDFVTSVTVEDGHVEAVARREDSARLNKALVDAGIAVFSLIPRETTLEDFFMELTGGTSGDRSAAGGRRIHA
ncbi:MAG TPA: ABC transporter ATP-binding protein, partial [Nitrospirota bacterium]